MGTFMLQTCKEFETKITSINEIVQKQRRVWRIPNRKTIKLICETFFEFDKETKIKL